VSAPEALAKIGAASGTADGWGWATDGSQIVALAGVEMPVSLAWLSASAYDSIPAKVSNWVAEAMASKCAQFDLAALREWSAIGPCERCKGSKRARCTDCRGVGHHIVTCDDCDVEHECKCHSCDGTGIAECGSCANKRPAILADICFDRRLLAAALAVFPESGSAWVSGMPKAKDAGHLVVWTEGARLILMGLRYFGEERDPMPHFPPCAAECQGCESLAASKEAKTA
jgi:hypothetical protein